MGRNIKFVSSQRIISKLIRDTGFTDISEPDMIEWIGEALGGINTTGIKDTKVLFATIENYQGKLPSNVEEILQVLRSNEDYRYSAMEVSAGCKVEEFDKSVPELLEISPCGCGTEPIPSKELPTWTHDFEVLDNYMQLKGRPTINVLEKFSTMRLSNSSFFSGIVCESEYLPTHGYCASEYQVMNDVIKTSFKSGQIAIAYRTSPVDASGFPLVPDITSVHQAITSYITYKIMLRYWYQGREGYGDKFQKAEQDWQWYCKQAKNDTFLPYGIDDHQDMLEFNQKTFKTGAEYYTQFRNVGRR